MQTEGKTLDLKQTSWTSMSRWGERLDNWLEKQHVLQQQRSWPPYPTVEVALMTAPLYHALSTTKVLVRQRLEPKAASRSLTVDPKDKKLASRVQQTRVSSLTFGRRR